MFPPSTPYYTARQLRRMAEPATEPVTLAEVKSYLRLNDADAQDALITDLIITARLIAEEHTDKSLITQSWRISYDDAAPAVVPLPHGPVQAITHVKSIDKAGNETTIDAASYHINSAEHLCFDRAPSAHQIRITYTAGFGDNAEDVPADLRQGMLLHIAHLYEHRDSLTPPIAAQLSYAYHREFRL